MTAHAGEDFALAAQSRERRDKYRCRRIEGMDEVEPLLPNEASQANALNHRMRATEAGDRKDVDRHASRIDCRRADSTRPQTGDVSLEPISIEVAGDDRCLPFTTAKRQRANRQKESPFLYQQGSTPIALRSGCDAGRSALRRSQSIMCCESHLMRLAA